MIRQTAMEWKQRLILTGVAALLSPVALSAEVTPAGQLDVITVTAPRVVSEVRPTKIEVDMAALITLTVIPTDKIGCIFKITAYSTPIAGLLSVIIPSGVYCLGETKCSRRPRSRKNP